MSLYLGCFDSGTSQSEIDSYKSKLVELSGVSSGQLICDAGVRRLIEASEESLTVAELQQFLLDAGFYPQAKVDAIFGYRTHSATRLFQEYVRHYENHSNCLPDGIVGPLTRSHIVRWLENNISANWSATLSDWQEGRLAVENSYSRWLEFLTTVKSHYCKNSSPQTDLVNSFTGKTDTLKPIHWDYEQNRIHLIGIRRKDQDPKRKFDDIFVLLLRGLVFKFQGSTDPGSSSHEDGAPFLVTGQHRYRFGLHRRSYHALRPFHFDKANHGVLVVRSKGDYKLSEADIKRGVSANTTINIHWGGKGVGRAVNRWSEGCQVLAGSGYEDFQGELVNCSSYVAINNSKIKETGGSKTRGAYNVLGDLITAFGSGLPTEERVYFTLIDENDCSLHDSISAEVNQSLKNARQFMTKLA